MITLITPRGESKIDIGNNGLKKVMEWVKKKHPEGKPILVVDDFLYPLYKKEIKKDFGKNLCIPIPAGEANKSIKTIITMAEKFLKEGVGRNDVVIGLGGGMTTDIAGFLASIYMRGIASIAIPTTLLGMVDAAIGSKTGVDFKAKNILGTFYPAELIMVDPLFIEKLPERQVFTGLAEVVKYAITLDKTLIKDLEKEKLDYQTIIKKSILCKVRIVNKDHSEMGLRKVLNFGHTFGHAIEAASHYKLTHGEAISIGMMISNRIARKLGKQDKKVNEITEKLLKRFNLPTEKPKNIQWKTLLPYIKNDKKRMGDKISFVIAPKIGKFEFIALKPEKLIELAQ